MVERARRVPHERLTASHDERCGFFRLSCAGLYAAKDFAPDYCLFARLEVGVNLVDFDRLLNPKANAPKGTGTVVPG